MKSYRHSLPLSMLDGSWEKQAIPAWLSAAARRTAKGFGSAWSKVKPPMTTAPIRKVLSTAGRQAKTIGGKGLAGTTRVVSSPYLQAGLLGTAVAAPYLPSEERESIIAANKALTGAAGVMPQAVEEAVVKPVREFYTAEGARQKELYPLTERHAKAQAEEAEEYARQARAAGASIVPPATAQPSQAGLVAGGTAGLTHPTAQPPEGLSAYWANLPNWAKGLGLLGLSGGVGALGSQVLGGEEEDEYGRPVRTGGYWGPLLGLGTLGTGALALSGWDPSKLISPEFWMGKGASFTKKASIPAILVPRLMKLSAFDSPMPWEQLTTQFGEQPPAVPAPPVPPPDRLQQLTSAITAPMQPLIGAGKAIGQTPPGKALGAVGAGIAKGVSPIVSPISNVAMPEQISKPTEIPPPVADAAKQKMVEQVTGGAPAPPGLWDQVTGMWERMPMEQKIMMLVGLGLGVGGLAHSFGGGGGAWGPLLGIGGLGLAGYMAYKNWKGQQAGGIPVADAGLVKPPAGAVGAKGPVPGQALPADIAAAKAMGVGQPGAEAKAMGPTAVQPGQAQVPTLPPLGAQAEQLINTVRKTGDPVQSMTAVSSAMEGMSPEQRVQLTTNLTPADWQKLKSDAAAVSKLAPMLGDKDPRKAKALVAPQMVQEAFNEAQAYKTQTEANRQEYLARPQLGQ